MRPSDEAGGTDDGNLEQVLNRAKAYDLHAGLPKSPVNPNAKVLD